MTFFPFHVVFYLACTLGKLGVKLRQARQKFFTNWLLNRTTASARKDFTLEFIGFGISHSQYTQRSSIKLGISTSQKSHTWQEHCFLGKFRKGNTNLKLQENAENYARLYGPFREKKPFLDASGLKPQIHSIRRGRTVHSATWPRMQ